MDCENHGNISKENLVDSLAYKIGKHEFFMDLRYII